MDDNGCRLLVLAMLIRGLRAARRGNAQAQAWVMGPDAKRWADALDLDDWPPTIQPTLDRGIT